MENIEIFDSTLRDGTQGADISFSVEDKLNIISVLDDLGIDFIEAGNPGSNPAEAQFFNTAVKLPLKNSQLVAFGSTRRKDISACDDHNLQSLKNAGTTYVAIFGKSHIFHATKILGVSAEENLAMISDSIQYLKENGKKVIFDAEHFFDGYKTDKNYTLKTLQSAAMAGAERICLCDTNGGIFPDEVSEILTEVTKLFPTIKFGIHCHNDGGLAVADSIEAVLHGAIQVQGTLLGIGERCGNANLTSIICNLQLKRHYPCLPEECLNKLYRANHKIAEIANIAIAKNQPYIGDGAFAHKAGMHADGVLKSHSSFEHIAPETVGNERHFLLSEISGKSAIYEKIHAFFPTIEKNSSEMANISNELKNRALQGYQYEAAEASFILLVKKVLGEYHTSFDLINLKIINEQPAIENVAASAIVKVRVGQITKLSAADGVGPVDAMDIALRKALKSFYPIIEKMTLTDYKVRVLDSCKATASMVRVLITSTDEKGSWTTVGVSNDVIQASWIALVDSVDYALLRNA